MIIDFDKLPDYSRIWVYTANQRLEKQAQNDIIKLTADFLSSWAAHGQDLTAGCCILHDHFLVIAVDESRQSVSGCSIDASVRAVKQVEAKTGIIFSDRSRVPFLHNGQIELVAFPQLRSALAAGRWSAQSVTFDPAVETKGDLNSSWQIPASSSWLNRYLTSSEVTS